MSTPTTTLRLRPHLREEIGRLAKRHRRSFSEVTQDLIEEALRLRSCPGIYFADEPAGREAKVSGTGLGVWELIRDYNEIGKNGAKLRKLFPQLSAAQVQAALIYYSRYADEIDDAIEDNRGLTWEDVKAQLGSLVKQA